MKGNLRYTGKTEEPMRSQHQDSSVLTSFISELSLQSLLRKTKGHGKAETEYKEWDSRREHGRKRSQEDKEETRVGEDPEMS